MLTPTPTSSFLDRLGAALRNRSAATWAGVVAVMGTLILLTTAGHHYMTDATDLSSPGTLLTLSGVVVPWLLIQGFLSARRSGWREFGFERPRHWGWTVLQALGAAVGIMLLFGAVINPAVVQWTGDAPDVNHLLGIRGNLPAFLLVLTSMWITAAFGEEMIVRGYVLNRLAHLMGGHRLAWGMALVLSSALFGMGHFYQGWSGILLTGGIGLAMGGVYLATGRNLWVPIIAHGLIDTVSLTSLYLS